MTRLIDAVEVRRAVGFTPKALHAVEQAYVWMRERRVSMPPVFHIDIDPQSAVDVKGAYVDGLDGFAIKAASGFYRNGASGLPSSSSVVLLFCAKTGFCNAVFLDNGYLMNLRTALAGAVAAKHLARAKIRSVGVVGTGVQARAQLQALALVRRFDEVLIWGRNREKAALCARDCAGLTRAEVRVADDLPDLVGRSDVLITTTQASDPLIEADWLSPGTHITAMGSDLPGKQELTTDALLKADLFVCDSIAQCEVGGELQHVAQKKLRRPALELSDVICDPDRYRRSDTDITICDMTGLGVLDTAIALAAFDELQTV